MRSFYCSSEATQEILNAREPVQWSIAPGQTRRTVKRAIPGTYSRRGRHESRQSDVRAVTYEQTIDAQKKNRCIPGIPLDRVVTRYEVSIGPCLTCEACAISYSKYSEEVDIEVLAMSPSALATWDKTKFPTMHETQERYMSRETRLGAQQYSSCILRGCIGSSAVPYEMIPAPTGL